jgi:hypothetical protein
MRAPVRQNRHHLEMNQLPRAAGSGYPLQVLGLLRAYASLWAFRCYPCPMPAVYSLGRSTGPQTSP